MDNTIFVQIASYRDPQLVPTLDDLLANADNPDNLKICIGFQYSDEDSFTKDLDKYRGDKRFDIIDIHYLETRGACYARNLIQQHYSGEKYTLQLDSHHRFVKGWDTICIDMLEGLRRDGSEKPLLTAYLPSFNPNNDPKERADKPWGMKFDRFTPEGVVFMLPYWFDNPPIRPVKTRFYSAHFCFTDGIFCEEVPHDPEFYFHGEEISIAVRAFTHGYDLFHPNKMIAFHEYTRQGRTKHWDDDKDWYLKNENSHKRLRTLLEMDGLPPCSECQKKGFGRYYLGNKRTLQDYVEYSGIRFSDRAVQQQTLDNTVPPNYPAEFFQRFRHAIDLHKGQFPQPPYDFWAFILENETGHQLHREDITAATIQSYLTNPTFTHWVEYNGPKPYKWIVWPHNEKGWADKIEKVL